jgi:hypothetical protein
MKPESITDQILSLANGLAHKRLLGRQPGTPIELSEVNLASLTVVAAVLEVLTIEQRQAVLEKLKSL